MKAYEILHPINIMTNEAEAHRIKAALHDLGDFEIEGEPYFHEIRLWDTESEKPRGIVVKSCWAASDFDRIVDIAGGSEFVKIGHTDMTLDQCLAEVDVAVKSEQEEHERRARIMEGYDEEIDNYIVLKEYGYEGRAYKIMQAKAGNVRNRLLEDIRDNLHEIAETLKERGL